MRSSAIWAGNITEMQYGTSKGIDVRVYYPTKEGVLSVLMIRAKYPQDSG